MKTVLFSLLVASVGATAALTMGNPAYARGDLVTMTKSFTPGTIVVRTNERRLYYVTGVGQAIRYPVGVGRAWLSAFEAYLIFIKAGFGFAC